MFSAEILKISDILSENFYFLVVKFSVYLNRHVFVIASKSVVSYVAFVLSLFVPHLSFFWCLGKTVLRDCGIYWTLSFIFLIAEHSPSKVPDKVPDKAEFSEVTCIYVQMFVSMTCFSVKSMILVLKYRITFYFYHISSQSIGGRTGYQTIPVSTYIT